MAQLRFWPALVALLGTLILTGCYQPEALTTSGLRQGGKAALIVALGSQAHVSYPGDTAYDSGRNGQKIGVDLDSFATGIAKPLLAKRFQLIDLPYDPADFLAAEDINFVSRKGEGFSGRGDIATSQLQEHFKPGLVDQYFVIKTQHCVIGKMNYGSDVTGFGFLDLGATAGLVYTCYRISVIDGHDFSVITKYQSQRPAPDGELEMPPVTVASPGELAIMRQHGRMSPELIQTLLPKWQALLQDSLTFALSEM